MGHLIPGEQRLLRFSNMTDTMAFSRSGLLLVLINLCLVLSQEDDTDTTTRRILIKPWSRLPIVDVNEDSTTADASSTTEDNTNGGGGPLVPVPCTLANNTLGTCSCVGQLFVAEECHMGFFCLNEQQFPGYDGCEISCQADEVLIVDPRNSGSWACKKVSDNSAVLGSACPGKFNTECGCDDASNPGCEIGECACDGQLWVSHDCHTGRFCDAAHTPDGYWDMECGEGQIIYVNLVDHTWACGDDDGRCPGSFHVGCQDDSYDEGGSSSVIGSLALVIAALLL